MLQRICFGMLCGLHANGQNAETNLIRLLGVGVRLFAAAGPFVTRIHLAPLLISAIASSTAVDQEGAHSGKPEKLDLDGTETTTHQDAVEVRNSFIWPHTYFPYFRAYFHNYRLG
ncbi:unnamed protein product [Protopolystoma xenopodis]|uniref:Uncharacterized protein n=1 Tax=Protopolystoma xenopodis TaxID=117903 RepID=A0A3S5B5U9_9PLAT|nr:unnamed protein product [Protopolystoma xenopodis]